MGLLFVLFVLLSRSQDDVNAWVGVDWSAEFSYFQRVRGIFEWFLHHSFLEEAQITTVLCF